MVGFSSGVSSWEGTGMMARGTLGWKGEEHIRHFATKGLALPLGEINRSHSGERKNLFQKGYMKN